MIRTTASSSRQIRGMSLDLGSSWLLKSGRHEPPLVARVQALEGRLAPMAIRATGACSECECR